MPNISFNGITIRCDKCLAELHPGLNGSDHEPDCIRYIPPPEKLKEIYKTNSPMKKENIFISFLLFTTAFLLVMGAVSYAHERTATLGASVLRAGPAYLYPPLGFGRTNPAVTQSNISSTICKSGWTATVRPPTSITNQMKANLMKLQHLPGTAADYELDHFLSIEDGGSPTDPNNLWMEAYASPDKIGARNKDAVETHLKTEVCNGSMMLAAAQHILLTDWYAYWKANFSNTLGASPETVDQDDK